MIEMKCKVCGGSIIPKGEGYVCDSCGIPESELDFEDTALVEAMNRASAAERSRDYAEAVRAYTALVARNPRNASAHWGLLMSKFGVEYVADRDAAGRLRGYKPTIHRMRMTDLEQDENFRAAKRYADDAAFEWYDAQGAELNRILTRLKDILRTEKDYDVFISFKARNDDGTPSRDNEIARRIYEQLSVNGVRCFFSEESLKQVSGDEYEPHIFAALNSARVMVLVGTDYGYISSAWVKNEWSRYLDLMNSDKSIRRVLIPVCEGLSPQLLPKDLPAQNAVDWSAGYEVQSELIRTIVREVGAQSALNGNDEADRLIREAQEKLTVGDFAAAVKLGREAVSHNPNAGDGWFLLLLAENHLTGAAELAQTVINTDESRYFGRAMETARGLRRQALEEAKNAWEAEVEKRRKDAGASREAALAEENSRRKIAEARAKMQAGHYAEADALLRDNIVLSQEAAQLRDDCELGMEYEKINKETWLTEQLSKQAPAEMKQLIAMGKHNQKEKKTNVVEQVIVTLGDSSPRICFLSATAAFLATAFSTVAYLLKSVVSAFGKMITSGSNLEQSPMLVTAIALLVLVCCWMHLGFSGLIGKIVKITISYFVSMLFAMMVLSGNLIVKLIGTAVTFLLFHAYYEEQKRFYSGNTARMTKLYEAKIRPMEQKLNAEYEQRYAPLNKYAAVERLTTVIEKLI